MLLPSPDHEETFDRLDALYTCIRSAPSSAGAADAVSRHVGSLFSGIENTPYPMDEPVPQDSAASCVRWVQRAVNAEIDRTLLALAESRSRCLDCSRQWSAHLLHARAVIADWAWVRTTEHTLT